MHESHLKPCYMRLIQSLKMNQAKNFGITVFIGAGCSLSSSNKDISTYGIIKELVKQFSFDEPIPEDWRKLYEIFVNTVWNGQGAKNRSQLLEDFFQDMNPSEGYQTLRWLLENKYINNIITTNFDLMIDRVLDGLSYYLIVGEHIEVIGDTPQFTLIKAHGDLRVGQLRFSPEELAKLPEKLTESIRKITKCVMIVIGYRGQDTGILNALYDTDEYNAYWISIDEPDRMNIYDYQQVHRWMYKRNSEGNFLYGQEYGEFDSLLKKIKETIVALKEKKNKINTIGELWEHSIVFAYLSLNKRFYYLFETLNEYLEQQICGMLWRSASPYYAPSYEKLARSALELIKETIIPTSYYCIDNEVDALVFSISCTIWLVCQGYPFTAAELLTDMRQKFEREKMDVIISGEFWDILSLLSTINTSGIRDSERVHSPISFCFDIKRDFSTILRHIDLRSIQGLLSIIEILLLFVQTSGSESKDYIRHQDKKTLEKYLYEIKNRDNRIALQMSSMPEDIYKNLYETLFKPYFAEHRIGERITLYRSPIYVDITIQQVKLDSHVNVWESLVQESQIHYWNFINNFSIGQYINRSCFEVFADFLKSQSSGLFIIGESGCGKTSALKIWLSGLSSEQYIICAVNGRDLDGRLELGEKIFSELFADQNILGHVQIMLEQRQQTLLLILDAINEIQGNFSHIMSNYKALLVFANTLTSKALNNIKLVLTCRSDLYFQLKKGGAFAPSTSSFYSSVVNNEVSTVYSIPYFDKQDAETFAELYGFTKSRELINELLDAFGNLIYLPINLQMICDAYHVSQSSRLFPEKDMIFDIWFGSLQKLGESEGIPKERISSIIEFTINYNYFSCNDEGLKTHIMAASLTPQGSDTLAVYEWLINHGVYDKNALVPNQIQFSHDRLEEYFLANYIFRYYGNNIYDLGSILSPEHSNLAVLEKALINVLIRTFLSDKFIFINSMVQIIRNKSQWMQPVIIHAIFQIIKTNASQGYNVLKEIEQYLIKKDFFLFLEDLLQAFKQELEINNNADLQIIKIINQIIETTNSYYNINLRATGLYLLAKGQFLLPSVNDEDKYTQALNICEDAEQSITADTSDELVNHISILKAMLLQNQGHLNEAIDLMEICYNRQKKKGLYDSACRSALYLGTMYRDMTRFDEAISLYDSIDTQYLRDETNLNRLYMNKGIIYKNKVQNAMFENSPNQEQKIEFYTMALECFNKTCIFSENRDDVPLRLEIYAELVECMCLAYYLNLGTISEAVHWVVKMDEIIGRYSVPVEQIQLKRMWARVLTLQCKFTESIQYLEEGYSIAVSYNIPFRATDCCNLITGIISDNLNNSAFATDEILQKGLTYGEYAINYYNALKNSNHRYLQDSIIKYNKIKDFWQRTHPSN